MRENKNDGLLRDFIKGIYGDIDLNSQNQLNVMLPFWYKTIYVIQFYLARDVGNTFNDLGLRFNNLVWKYMMM